MPKPVIIVEYNPEWPRLYEDEKLRIMGSIGHKIRAIEHMGSTSVPGLGAKPIIDIIAGVGDSQTADECVTLLAGIGYDDVTPEPDNQDWFYCLGTGRLSVGYHLHLVRYGSDHWERHMIFRNYLRENPAVADEYFALKKDLAERFRDDRISYTEAKSKFISSVVDGARKSNLVK